MENNTWQKMKSYLCLNKADVKDKVLELIDLFYINSQTDGTKTAVYYYTLIELLKRFYSELDNLVLMETLEEFWGYDCDVTYLGVQLNLVHYYCSEEVDELNESSIHCDEVYTLFRVDSKLLTVEEYANRYGVEEVTVRQWIRRGKIRTAIKCGNEWRIPELTDIPPRGWRNATYYWDKELVLDCEYAYLNDYNALTIIQDEHDKSKYELTIFKRNTSLPPKRLVLDVKEKEKFELFCISNPDIHYLEMVMENYEIDLMR